MKIIKIIAGVMLVFSGVFTLTVGKSAISDNGVSVSPKNYEGIITLWHIDTFEGGVGSRKQFLNSVSRGFEKQNTGVLVFAVDHTPESAENAMLNGEYPDIISYGTGVNIKNFRPVNVTVQASNGADLTGGVLSGETYAVPWCRGGYCVIENPYVTGEKNRDVLLVSQGEFTNPLCAYALSGKGSVKTESLSPMNAYVRFTAGKQKRFLGTQRDIHRLILRGMDFTSVPLTGYNDLYQYISVCSADERKIFYAEKFVEYLISEKIQKRLSEIGMFSCFFQVEYDSPDLRSMQSARIESMASAFFSKEYIEIIRASATIAVTGDEKELYNLKKLIALS